MDSRVRAGDKRTQVPLPRHNRKNVPLLRRPAGRLQSGVSLFIVLRRIGYGEIR